MRRHLEVKKIVAACICGQNEKENDPKMDHFGGVKKYPTVGYGARIRPVGNENLNESLSSLNTSYSQSVSAKDADPIFHM